MILAGQALLERAPSIIQPYEQALVNPASVDIRVGMGAVADTPHGWKSFSLAEYTADNPYYLNPGEFMLVSTLESFHLPSDMAMELRLKSSRAREGYNHALAFWVDPGWKGILTMELMNVRTTMPLPLYPGLKIAQVLFHLLHCGSQTVSYQGHYQDAKGVEGSKVPARG